MGDSLPDRPAYLIPRPDGGAIVPAARVRHRFRYDVRMIRARISCLVLLICSSLAAETRWIHLQSRDLHVYSSASEGRSREVLRHFEATRGFFTQVIGQTGHGRTPACIVVFGSEKDWGDVSAEKIRDRLLSSRLCLRLHRHGPGCVGTRCLSPCTNMSHLVARNSRLKLPIWLNEGLAELYSTLQPRGDKVVVGVMIGQHLQALRGGRWAPLADILAAGRDSPYYNDEQKASRLYSEGWALTHMLSLNEAYRSGFSRLLAEIGQGTDSVAALTTVYGKPLNQIEADLHRYIDGFAFRGLLFPVALDNARREVAVEPVAAPDVELLMTELSLQPEDAEESRRRLASPRHPVS